MSLVSTPHDPSPPFDAVVEEFLHQIRCGGSPSIHQYAEKYPGHADAILCHFPGLIVAEKLAGQRHKRAKLDLPLPMQLGNFELVEEIGRGGMAVVYRAIHKQLSREFAVKVMSEDSADSRKRVLRFKQEAQVIAQLHHPAIVPLFEFGSQDSLYFIAMRMIDGLTFRQIFEQWESPAVTDLDKLQKNWRVLAGFFYEICMALSHVHKAGLVHRDIKPSNLMVDSDSRVWIADFGLAKLRTSDTTLETTTGLVGTPRYIAPECIRDKADERSDVFSLGVTMFEMFSGISAWGSKCRSLGRLDDLALPSLRQVDKQIPRRLAKIVKKATTQSPAHRYQSAQLLANDLRQFANGKRFILRNIWPFRRPKS